MSPYSICQLSKELDLSGFDCGDDDLNEFLKKDSFIYQKFRLAKTYVALSEKSQDVIAYFSLLNDKLIRSNDISKRQWNEKVKKHLSYQKTF